MQNDKINLLVTFDKNYIGPFRVMLKSLVVNNSDERFHVWLLHSAIPQKELDGLTEYCSSQRVALTAIQVERTFFENAPISKQYPQEMYYRLLAPSLLPDTLEKILYIDPDILVINPVRPIWEIDLKANVFAAASHSGVFDVMNDVNRVRLGKDHDYFNSGVMLMDLKKARALVVSDEIFACVRKYSAELLLPDQDVFNYLYGSDTLQIDDTVWNYDARYFSAYRLRSGGVCNMDWVMQNTVFLHFLREAKAMEGISFQQIFCIIQALYESDAQTEFSGPIFLCGRGSFLKIFCDAVSQMRMMRWGKDNRLSDD